MNNRVFASVTAFALLIIASTSHAFFKVPDTDFGAPKGLEMVGYETKSLLMKFNYKTQDLGIGYYSGTWKNRKSSGGFLVFDKRKTSTDITLEHDTYGTWTMFCSGMLKGLSFGGVSFDRNNKIDYQCVMQSGDDTARLEILPYKKPKFSMGPPKEERTVNIFLPDGSKMTAQSVHDFKDSRRSSPRPSGYKILKDGKIVGGLGRQDKTQAILISEDLLQDPTEHFVFMTGLALQFFTNNRLEKGPGDF